MLWRRRKVLIGCTAAAALASIVISLLLPNYYQAETRFLALSPDQSSPETLFGTTGMKPQLYGNMNDIDRLLAIAESNELVNFLVDTFNLYDHYEIERDKPKAAVSVRRKFFGLYEVTKTPRDAIMIEVEDKVPTMAADLANAARERIDFLSRRIIKDAQRQNVGALMGEIKSKESQLLVIGDSLQTLRDYYKIYDLETQQEVLSTQIAEVERDINNTTARIGAFRGSSIQGGRDSIAKLGIALTGLRQSRISLDSQLQRMSSGMSPLMNLRETRANLSRNLNDDTERLKQYEAALRSQQPSIAVLETAREPEIKSRPKRSFIVIGATFVTFILALFGILLIETGKQYPWRDILE